MPVPNIVPLLAEMKLFLLQFAEVTCAVSFAGRLALEAAESRTAAAVHKFSPVILWFTQLLQEATGRHVQGRR